MFHMAFGGNTLNTGVKDHRVSLVHQSAEQFVRSTRDISKLVSTAVHCHSIWIKSIICFSYQLYVSSNFASADFRKIKTYNF